MAISEAIWRLLHVRLLEEGQHKHALDSAIADLNDLEEAVEKTHARYRAGKERVVASVDSSCLADRIVGLIECESAHGNAQLLAMRLEEAGLRVSEMRESYLSKRVERRQVETVIREAEALDAVESVRRDQQRMDEWFSTRNYKSRAHRHKSTRHDMKSCEEHASDPEGD